MKTHLHFNGAHFLDLKEVDNFNGTVPVYMDPLLKQEGITVKRRDELLVSANASRL